MKKKLRRKTKKEPDTSDRTMDITQMYMATDLKGGKELSTTILLSLLITIEEEICTLIAENRYIDMKTIKSDIEIIKDVFEVLGTTFPDLPNHLINKSD